MLYFYKSLNKSLLLLAIFSPLLVTFKTTTRNPKKEKYQNHIKINKKIANNTKSRGKGMMDPGNNKKISTQKRTKNTLLKKI